MPCREGGMKQEHWHRIAFTVLHNNQLAGDIFQDADLLDNPADSNWCALHLLDYSLTSACLRQHAS